MRVLLSLLFVVVLLASPWLAGPGAAESKPDLPKKLRVVVFGAHPDDPESGCGGLIALLTQAGHEVVVAYATCYRGEGRHGSSAHFVNLNQCNWLSGTMDPIPRVE